MTEWKYVFCKCSYEEFTQVEFEQHLPVSFDVRRTKGTLLAMYNVTYNYGLQSSADYFAKLCRAVFEILQS